MNGSAETMRDRGLRRIRLSQWAAEEGIARITAYRMLRKGILPVPTERSPTGRWYVLVQARRTERMAFYTRATRGPEQALVINNQIAALSEWATSRRRSVHVVAREIATPYVDRMPKLAELLADQRITEIVVENPTVLGNAQYQLLVAALAPQGRAITIANNDGRNPARRRELYATISGLCQHLFGKERGLAAAQRALRSDD